MPMGQTMDLRSWKVQVEGSEAIVGVDSNDRIVACDLRLRSFKGLSLNDLRSWVAQRRGTLTPVDSEEA